MHLVPLVLVLATLALPALADTVLAARTIRAQAILGPGDIALAAQDIAGTYATIDEAVGLEARVVLYAGRPIRIEDLGPPAIVDRNQIVTLIYRTGGLAIAAEGRALARAGIGDRLRVMNLASRQTVFGLVRPDGTVSVGPLSPSLLPQE
jgi:flagella basal body P-ring formation protein FlgA